MNEIVTFLEILVFSIGIKRYRLVIPEQISDPVETAVTLPSVEHSSMGRVCRSAVCDSLGGEIVWVR